MEIYPRGGSVFPLESIQHTGMDLHDWLTGASLAGLLANPKLDVTETAVLSDIVELARQCATEVLRQKAEE
ncbi:MAG: hypothetical protein IIA66_09030 [Planctomycetes bacterium]|nr:hypothetical protein [Planctomycetota bacterium]